MIVRSPGLDGHDQLNSTLDVTVHLYFHTRLAEQIPVHIDNRTAQVLPRCVPQYIAMARPVTVSQMICQSAGYCGGLLIASQYRPVSIDGDD